MGPCCVRLLSAVGLNVLHDANDARGADAIVGGDELEAVDAGGSGNELVGGVGGEPWTESRALERDSRRQLEDADGRVLFDLVEHLVGWHLELETAAFDELRDFPEADGGHPDAIAARFGAAESRGLGGRQLLVAGQPPDERVGIEG
jgi:hypothetical protein